MQWWTFLKTQYTGLTRSLVVHLVKIPIVSIRFQHYNPTPRGGCHPLRDHCFILSMVRIWYLWDTILHQHCAKNLGNTWVEKTLQHSKISKKNWVHFRFQQITSKTLRRKATFLSKRSELLGERVGLKY